MKETDLHDFADLSGNFTHIYCEYYYLCQIRIINYDVLLSWQNYCGCENFIDK